MVGKSAIAIAEAYNPTLDETELKGIKLHMQGLEFEGFNASMKKLHKSARDVFASKANFSDWGPLATKVLDSKGNPLVGLHHTHN